MDSYGGGGVTYMLLLCCAVLGLNSISDNSIFYLSDVGLLAFLVTLISWNQSHPNTEQYLQQYFHFPVDYIKSICYLSYSTF